MNCKNINDERWAQFNLNLKFGLKNCELYPEQTTFLAELSNALRSASGNGRIDWEVMERIDEQLNECRKKLGDPVMTGLLV